MCVLVTVVHTCALPIFLRAANALTNPMWLVRSMYNAYTDHDPVDFAGAGAVLAQLGEHYAGRTDSDEAAALEEYGLLSRSEERRVGEGCVSTWKCGG